MFRIWIVCALGLFLVNPGNASSQKAVDLAVAGHCAEAMPLLDEAMRDSQLSTAEKRPVSTAGVRCSMLLDRQNDAMSFLAWLQQNYPADPDILFLSVHVFSDLSQRNAKALMRTAPESPLVIQLNAETFEQRGEPAKAIAEYRILTARVPDQQGVHYRIGGLLMSQRTAPAAAAAQKEFEEELRLNPRNASAEFYLGELSLQNDLPKKAIEHYNRAVTLYPGFTEAFARLGRALLDSGQTAEAIPPLEKATTLAPDDPAIHQALGTAYQRAGRKADAASEFEKQKSTALAIHENEKVLRKNVSGVETPKQP
jgi:tetratricopeptide (TPR) repeat protein